MCVFQIFFCKSCTFHIIMASKRLGNHALADLIALSFECKSNITKLADEGWYRRHNQKRKEVKDWQRFVTLLVLWVFVSGGK